MQRRPTAIARWWMLLVLTAVPLHLSFSQEGQPYCEGAYTGHGSYYQLRKYYLLCEAEGTELSIRHSLHKSDYGPWSGRLDLEVTNRDAESFDFVPDRDVVISAEFTGRKKKDCEIRLMTVEEQEQRVWDDLKEEATSRDLGWIITDRGFDEAEYERAQWRVAEEQIAALKRWAQAHTLASGENARGWVEFDLPHRKCAITSIAIQVGTARYVFDPKQLRKLRKR